MTYKEFNNNKIIIEFEPSDAPEDIYLMRQAILFVKALFYKITK
jgi:hypothetical protein